MLVYFIRRKTGKKYLSCNRSGKNLSSRLAVWEFRKGYSMRSRALELKRDQILALIAEDFKRKYNSTVSGFLWSLLVPIFSGIIYCFVFWYNAAFQCPEPPVVSVERNIFSAILRFADDDVFYQQKKACVRMAQVCFSMR